MGGHDYFDEFSVYVIEYHETHRNKRFPLETSSHDIYSAHRHNLMHLKDGRSHDEVICCDKCYLERKMLLSRQSQRTVRIIMRRKLLVRMIFRNILSQAENSSKRS